MFYIGHYNWHLSFDFALSITPLVIHNWYLMKSFSLRGEDLEESSQLISYEKQNLSEFIENLLVSETCLLIQACAQYETLSIHVLPGLVLLMFLQ